MTRDLVQQLSTVFDYEFQQSSRKPGVSWQHTAALRGLTVHVDDVGALRIISNHAALTTDTASTEVVQQVRQLLHDYEIPYAIEQRAYLMVPTGRGHMEAMVMQPHVVPLLQQALVTSQTSQPQPHEQICQVRRHF